MFVYAVSGPADALIECGRLGKLAPKFDQDEQTKLTNYSAAVSSSVSF
jgi:hypothetical protein